MPDKLTKFTDNQKVSITEILDSREARRDRQAQWIDLYGSTIVSFTVVSPGEIKCNHAIRKIFIQGIINIHTLFQACNWKVLKSEELFLSTGPEFLASINEEAIKVKKSLIQLEESTPLSRLWDFDVFDKTKKQISRKDINLKPRKCILCEADATSCSRQRSHDLKDIINEIDRIVQSANLYGT